MLKLIVKALILLFQTLGVKKVYPDMRVKIHHQTVKSDLDLQFFYSVMHGSRRFDGQREKIH